MDTSHWDLDWEPLMSRLRELVQDAQKLSSFFQGRGGEGGEKPPRYTNFSYVPLSHTAKSTALIGIEILLVESYYTAAITDYFRKNPTQSE